ncbi:MAG TPA: hypothetical protein VNZ61_06705 [Roseomonas sp.]|nr:hypothetical protein [Roseomonas sp.]
MAVIRGTNQADVITLETVSPCVQGGAPTPDADGIRAGNGADTVRAGGGNDRILGENGDDQLWGEAGDDLLTGGNGNDRLHGGIGRDRLNGDNGDDRLWGDAGDDLLNGGRGTDEAIYAGPRSNYDITLAADGTVTVHDLNGAADGLDEGTDRLVGIEHLRFLGGAGLSLVRASTSSNGDQANGRSYSPELSADGTKLVFVSEASNLVPGDTNGKADVFLKDLNTGRVTLVSTTAGGEQGNDASVRPVISADGQYVAFASAADNFLAADANGHIPDIFVKNMFTGALTLVSTSSGGEQANSASQQDVVGSFDPSISADGRLIAFASTASNLVPDDTNRAFDVFVKDMVTGEVRLASASANGEQGNQSSSAPQLSADGTKLVFSSVAGNLVPNDSTGNGINEFVADPYYKDLNTGEVRLVNTSASGEQGAGGVYLTAISSDGSKVALLSFDDNMIPNDTNNNPDIFLKDMTTGAVTLVSASASGEQGNGFSSLPSISGDGRFIAFASSATNLAPGDTTAEYFDIFVKDVLTGAITRVSSLASGAEANDGSFEPSLSAGGSHIAFSSLASNLVPGDTNGVSDIFVADLNRGGEAVFAIGPDGALTPRDAAEDIWS